MLSFSGSRGQQRFCRDAITMPSRTAGVLCVSSTEQNWRQFQTSGGGNEILTLRSWLHSTTLEHSDARECCSKKPALAGVLKRLQNYASLQAGGMRQKRQQPRIFTSPAANPNRLNYAVAATPMLTLLARRRRVRTAKPARPVPNSNSAGGNGTTDVPRVISYCPPPEDVTNEILRI